MTLAQNEAPDTPEAVDENGGKRLEAKDLSSRDQAKDEDLQQQTVMGAYFSKKLDHVVLASEDDARALESKGFGIKEGDQYYLKDYEVLYLTYNTKLALKRMVRKGKKASSAKLTDVKFTDYVSFSLKRDENAWTRFLIFRDLRSRGYVVREGFGFPIDFRVYDRGDYGNKAAKYIVFGLNEGKTMSLGELKKHVDDMSTMGKEAVIAVVERRGEVIYYKVAKWRPIKPL
ncbi:MAG TPA: tRNA-intron lyase [Nitrososphaerales archaeon]|nr:tRNA-intron lyase [Nitrososphaerales archaeon]